MTTHMHAYFSLSVCFQLVAMNSFIPLAVTNDLKPQQSVSTHNLVDG